ncbi:hypothetical protein OIU76_028683 [Salix suchowensis]|uniref:mitogen-activated protein kinase kinase kinase n=1 Tax=Salix suchowensis TaxID=1278906 RepID=A0ABQ9B5X4_9ROSI|nr:hypothetical protein OIU76_028683 [Salix suchowensis]KAJ6371846.1 hypothetical protein OIU77_002210 [Salix suchowensis]
MPSSSTQAAVAPSCSFSDHVEAFARYVMRVVQALTPVVQAAAPPARYWAWLISQVIRSAENTARAILRILRCRSIQNAENTKITRRGRNITDWERGVLIGTGSFGSVYRGSNEDGSFFAAKGVSLNEHRHLCHLENEIAILKRLDHQNIIQYYGTEKDGEMLYIFLELVIHGTLEQAYKN